MAFVVIAAFVFLVWVVMELAVFAGEGIEKLWRLTRRKR
jgi:hypothetical protein